MEKHDGEEDAASRALVPGAILTEWATRLQKLNVSVRVASTQGVDRIASSYDTLVIGIPITPGFDLASNDAPLSTLATTLYDALRVWHCVSHCRGFSFQDEVAFWIRSMAITSNHPSLTPALELVRGSCVFPRIVLFWGGNIHYGAIENNPQDLRPLQRDVLDLFTRPDSYVPSQECQRDLEILQACMCGTSSLADESIKCVVRVRLGKSARSTSALLECVATQVSAIPPAPQEATLTVPRLQLTGLELPVRSGYGYNTGGLEMNHLKALQVLSSRLPKSVKIAVRSRRSGRRPPVQTPTRARELATFVQRLCGLEGSEFAGRLEVLDLTNAFGNRNRNKQRVPEFACLCTLLPLTVSLRELRVRILRKNDLLWLMYAIFHPQSRESSSWTSLVLSVDEDRADTVLDWQAVQRMLGAESRLEMLLNLLNSETSVFVGNGETLSAPQKRRTAVVTKQTPVYEMDQTTRLATLARGANVDVCDVTTEWVDTDDNVVVLVPGYGFGYVAKSNLTSITNRQDVEPSTSCITSLRMSPAMYTHHRVTISPTKQLGMLRVLGSSLKQLRVSYANWFQQRGFAELVPNVETIDCCTFTPQTSCSDFHALPKLRALGVACYEENITACFEELLYPCTASLQELHIQLTVSHERLSDGERLVQRLLASGGLRHLRIELAPVRYYQRMSLELGISDAGTTKHLARRKCAFLSVVHHAQTRSLTQQPSSGHALVDVLARLDAYVIQHVFGFCGSNLESLVVAQCETAFGHARGFSEVETRGDAWCGC